MEFGKLHLLTLFSLVFLFIYFSDKSPRDVFIEILKE